MSKPRKLKKLMAFLLAASMVCQQASITTIAEEAQAVVQDDSAAKAAAEKAAAEKAAAEQAAAEKAAAEKAAAEQAAAEKAAAEKAAAEQAAAEKAAAEKAAAEQAAAEKAAAEQAAAEQAAAEKAAAEQAAAEQAAQTEAPATEAPATEAPAETEAPATEAPAETEAPVTEAPAETEAVTEAQTVVETEAPAETEELTEAPTETEIETETESESESETETEAPKTSFRFEDSRVVITANTTKKADLPHDSVLQARYIAPGTGEFESVASVADAVLGEAEEDRAYLAYDIYFMADGKEIEPDASVSVHISFKQPAFSEVDAQIVDQALVHIADNGAAEQMASNIATNGEGEVTAVSFTSSEFSYYVVTGDTIAPSDDANNANAIDLSEIASIDVSSSSNFNNVAPNASFKFTLEFNVNNSDVEKAKQYAGGWVYDMSSIPNNTPAVIPDVALGYLTIGNKIGGEYSIKDGKVILKPYANELAKWTENIGGNFNFNIRLDEEKSKTVTEGKFEFPSTDDSFPFTLAQNTYSSKGVSTTGADYTYNASGDQSIAKNPDGTYTLYYEVKYTTDKALTSLNLTDTMSAGQSVKDGKVTLTYPDGNSKEVSVSGNPFTVSVDKVDDVIPEGTYTVKYATIVAADTNLEGITNSSKWTYNGNKETGPDNTSINIKGPSVNGYKKFSTDGSDYTNDYNITPVANPDGSYTIYYQVVGTTNLPLDSLVMKDTLGEGQVLDTSSVQIKYPDGTTQAGTVTNQNGGYFEVNIPNPNAAGSYEVSYSVTVSKEAAAKEVVNNAKWTFNGDKDSPNNETKFKIKKKIEASKSVTENPDGVFTYTITFGSEGESMKGANVQDFFSDNQRVTSGDKIAIKDKNGDVVANVDVKAEALDTNYSNNQQQVFWYQFPTDKEYADGPYTITYTTQAATYADFPAGTNYFGEHNVWNKFDVERDGDKGNAGTSTGHDFGEPDLRGGIEKDFDSFDFENNKANWSIAVNLTDGATELTNVVVKEVDHRYGGKDYQQNQSTVDWSSIKVYDASGNEVSGYTVDSAAGTITFAKLTQNVVVTLKTTAGDTLDDVAVYNKAELWVGGYKADEDDGYGYNAAATATVSKDFVGAEDANTAVWEITVTPETGKTVNNVVITDYDAGRWNDGGWQKLEDMTPDWDSVTVATLDGTEYTDFTVENGTVSFATLSEPVVIKIHTISNDGITNGQKVKNTAGISVNGKDGTPDSAEGTFKISGDFGIKKEVTVGDDGTYSWQIVINGSQVDFKDEKGDSVEITQLTFDDVFPDGMMIQGQVALYGYRGNDFISPGGGAPIEIKDTGLHADNILAWGWDGTPIALNNTSIYVEYKTVITDAKKKELGAHTPFKNVATVTLPDETTKTDEKTVWVDQQVVHKYDKGNVDDIINYEIVVNENGATINSGKPLELSDVLPTNVELVTNTISVTPSAGTLVGYHDDTRTLTVTVPDGVKEVVKFQVKSKEDVGQNIQYNNTVVLRGDFTQKDSTSEWHQFSEHSGTIHGEANSITLNKLDHYNLSEGLEGAEFEVYKCTLGSDNKITGETLHGEFTSNKDGNAVINQLTFGDLYYWVETKAPEGYEIDSTVPHYFMAYNDSNRDAVWAKDDAVSAANNITIKSIKEYDFWIVTDTKKDTVDVELEVAKTLKGRAAEANEFEFVITGVSAKNTENQDITPIPMPKTTTIKNAAADDGVAQTMKFDKISFEHEGTYVYTVSETKGEADGVTYDEEVYTVTIVVTRNQETGELEETHSYKKKDNSVATAIAFGNTYEENIEIPVTKIWNDNDDHDGVRPDEIIVTLYKNGTATDQTVTLKKTENWASKKFENLPKKENGSEIKYTVVETAVDGYTTTYSDDTFTITNKHELLKTTASVTKAWAPAAPENLNANDIANYFTLLQNGVAYTPETAPTVTTNSDGTYTVNWTNLPKIDDNKTEYVYTVKETNVPNGYTASTTDAVASGATITNTKNGGLTVSKTVTGNAADKTKVFNFTVTLNDTTIAGVYGDMTFAAGVAKFTLTDGQSKSATGLPNGVTYTVVEKEADQDGYTTTKTGDSGSITAGGSATAAFVNNKDTFGDLVVSKSVEGNAGDKNKEFSFTVTLSDNTINGARGGMTFTNGVATFTLKDGQSAKAEKLPNGITYTVTETKVDGYETTSTGATGTIIGNETATAAFTNTRNAEGSLTVKKTLTGNDTDSDKEFEIKVTLADTTINNTYNGVAFVNGVATLNLKGGESVEITGLPNGMGYTVSEKDYSNDGYTATYSGKTGTISETASAVAEVTNTRDTYGDLTVSKSVEGNAGDKNKEFSFTVTLSDKTINGTFKDMTFTNGVATFALKDGQSAKAENLPNGITYTVTETKVDGYVTTSTGATGTIDDETPATAAFTNTRNAEGSLTVKKTLAGNDTDSDKAFEIKVTLADKTINDTYNGVAFVNGVATLNLKGGESVEITGLPNGMGYTVSEEDYSNDGYTATYSGETGTISETASAVAEVTNTRNTYGKLTVTKTVSGNACDATKEFAFTVTLSDNTIAGTYGDMTFAAGEATFNLKHGESKTATKLPNGITYTVTEDSDGYEVEKAGDTGTIVGNTEAKATFVNTRNAEGSLKISKTLAGNDVDTTKVFTFAITLDPAVSATYDGVEFTDGKAEITLKGGESKTITGLPNGTTYTVEEKEANQGGYTTAPVSGKATGNITENGTANASFTNTRNTYGKLTVSKSVTGNAGDKNKAFNFTVTLSDKTINGTFKDMTFTNGVATFTLKNGESKTAENLPNGITYEVAEDSYEAEGYTTTVPSTSEGNIVGNQTATAAFVNTRNANGSLTVSKTTNGNDPDKDKEFTFTITLSPAVSETFDGVTFTNGVAEIKLKGGQSKTINGIPNGTTYTIVEKEANQGGNVTSSTGEAGTISETTAAVAAFTNTRNTYGNLTVTKTVSGNACDTNKEFAFTVKLSDNAIAGTYGNMTFAAGEATFNLKHGESKTATNLPNGITYTVTENSDGYDVEKSGDTGTIVGKTTKTAAFTNTRNADGSLKISKTLAGNDVDANKVFTFTITLNNTNVNGTYGPATFVNGVATITLKGGENTVITGLPNGVGYTVTEADYTGDGYVTTSTGTTGTIVESVVKEAAFTNTRNTYGDLTVTKTVTGNACDTTKEFAFTVTLSDNTIAGTYGDMTFAAGVATFNLKHGQSKTAEDLPNGITYTVTETSYTADGYETTSTGATGTIDDETPATAAFVNTRDTYGSLKISKTLAGNDTDANKDFTFTITLNDATINNTFSNVEFTNGAATITLKGGQNKVIAGLPNGVGYTVTEADYTGAGYTTTSTGTTGTIVEATVKEAAFTNTRDTFGDLSVTKTVAGNAGDSDKDFAFTVTLSDNTIAGTYGEMTFAAGVATFNLKDGQTKTAEDLPNGITYTVTERSYTADGYVTTSTGATGTIDDETPATAAFVNTRNANGSLTVSKTVTGNDPERDPARPKEFTITITLADNTINQTFSGVAFVNGVASIDLKGGESKTFDDLPNRMGYTVTEADYSTDGYVVTYEGETGTINEHVPAVAAITNTRDTFGDLTVTKSVPAGDATKEFTFTVTLNDTSIAGTHGDMTFAAGVATFKLKAGESAKAEDLPNGVGYTVTEEDYAKDGYTTKANGEKGKSVTGTIDDEVPATAAFENTITTVKVSKWDVTNDKELAGATIQIKDSKGEVVEEWKSTEEAKTITGLKVGETYTLHEEVAPDGYTYATDSTFTIDEEGKVTTTGSKTTDGVLLVNDALTSVKVSKWDVTNDKELAGATIQIKDSKGNVVEEWKSTEEAKEIKGLKVGETYTLHEEVAPEGYTYATDTTFTIDKEGKVTTTGSKTSDGVLLVNDALTSVKVSKWDVTNDKELAGAKIQIKDSKGNVVKEWTSSTTAEEIKGLKVGETYTLHEEVAPDGYTYATDTTFTIDKEGKVTTTGSQTTDGVLLVNDALTSVKISKVDVATGEELEGATIQIIDKKTGKVVEEWKSTTKPHEITGLTPGREYILRETVAPEGYEVTTDTTFVLDKEGKIDHSKTTTTVSEEGVLLVEDSMKHSDKASVKVTKTLTVKNGGEIKAQNDTFYVALFYDEECTKPASEVKAITFNESSSSTVEFQGLDIGRTYYVSETDESGVSIAAGAAADGTVFIANFKYGNTAKVTENDGTTTVTFENEFYKVPKKYYKEGTLTITKKVLGTDGKPKKAKETFYAGIFKDKDHKIFATDVVPVDSNGNPMVGFSGILELKLNDQSEISANVKVGIYDGSTTLYIIETDKDGKPIAGAKGFKYDVSVDKTSVTMSSSSPNASVVITNKEKKSGGGGGNGGNGGGKSAKTGDNTPIEMYLGLFLAAAVVLAEGERRRRMKKRNQE